MKRSAPNVADQVADRVTTHTVNLLRFDADLRGRVRRLLQQVERDIVAQLMSEDPSTIARPTFRERRLLALAEQVRATLRTGYRTIAGAHERALRELASLEEEFSRTKINDAIGADVMTVGVSEATLREIARDTLIDGAPSRDWWGGQADRTGKAFVRQIRIGLVEGESVGDLIRRVRGTKAAGYTDGIMQVSRREAEALVRTSVQAVSNAARMETYRANPDVVKGTQWVSTLDGRTTLQCIALDGASWDLDGSPLPDSPYQRPDPDPGAPPLHWNCRSVRTAVLKSVREMLAKVGPRKAGKIKALPHGTRASMDGQVAASLTFAEWLQQKEAKGPGFADALLGKTRANLWRAGKLPLTALIDQSGNPLDLDGLRDSVRGVTAKAIEKARAA